MAGRYTAPLCTGAAVERLEAVHLRITVETLMRKGRSQREIERLTGVDRKTIRRYERGRAEKAAGKLIETFLGAHFSGAPRDRCRFLLSHELSASQISSARAVPRRPG